MNAEFQWWLLILGIVIGGALVYLVLADIRSDDDGPDWLGDDPPPWDPEAVDSSRPAADGPDGAAPPPGASAPTTPSTGLGPGHDRPDD